MPGFLNAETDCRSTPEPPAIRRLSIREIATIRAALRLWIETPVEFIGDRCYEEIDHAPALEGDDAIERLLQDLATADQVLLRVLR